MCPSSVSVARTEDPAVPLFFLSGVIFCVARLDGVYKSLSVAFCHASTSTAEAHSTKPTHYIQWLSDIPSSAQSARDYVVLAATHMSSL